VLAIDPVDVVCAADRAALARVPRASAGEFATRPGRVCWVALKSLAIYITCDVASLLTSVMPHQLAP